MANEHHHQPPIQVFQRGPYKNAFRWLTFGAILAIDASCIISMINFISTHPGMVNGAYILRVLILFGMLVFMNLLILPTVILEARKVEVLENELVIHNLLYTSVVPWSDIRKVTAPIFLKFAIVRTPKWFALINKRDVEHFSDLMQIITEKAEAAGNR